MWIEGKRKRQRLFARRYDRGASILEFSVAFPILLLILAATIDFGYYFYRTTQLREHLYKLTNQQTSLEHPRACEVDAAVCNLANPSHECTLERWCANDNDDSSGLKGGLANALFTSITNLRSECEWIDVFSSNNGVSSAPFALRVNVEWSNPCFFCGVLPFDANVRVGTVSVIEGCV